MAKTKKVKAGIFTGLDEVGKAIGNIGNGFSLNSTATATKHRYKQTHQVKGRIARALAHETHGGKGKDSLRAGYKYHMKKGYKQVTPQERAKIVIALAKNTVKGKGRIAKRPAYTKYVKY